MFSLIPITKNKQKIKDKEERMWQVWLEFGFYAMFVT